MAEQLVVPVATIASFRRSLYDDAGGTITLDALEADEKDGVPLLGADRTPAWLAHTTDVENTAEGPNGDREYLHVDIDIDTDHASITEGSTYKILIKATDAGGDQRNFSFLFTNGRFDFTSVTGFQLWIAARKETKYTSDGMSLATPPTNFALATNITGPTTGYTIGTYASFGAGLRPSFRLKTAELIAPVQYPVSSSQAFSMFTVVRSDRDMKAPNYLMSQGADNELYARLMISEEALYYLRETGVSRIRRVVGAIKKGSVHLIEIHRNAAGLLTIAVDNEVGYSQSEGQGFANAPFYIAGRAGDPYAFDGDIMEAGVFYAELSSLQKTEIRRTLLGIYEDLDYTP